jgi:hypothetical protein
MRETTVAERAPAASAGVIRVLASHSFMTIPECMTRKLCGAHDGWKGLNWV